MTREDIIRMAREAGFQDLGAAEMWGYLIASKGHIERFAGLVAAHALANIDPSKLMSYQEGYEAGRTAEREACAQVCETEGSTDDLPEHYAAACRARGEK